MAERTRLCDFIRDNRQRILAAWEEEVRKLPVAAGLSGPRLLDHLPHLLGQISHVVRTVHNHRDEDLEEWPEVHALDRLDSGFDLSQVAAEYALLRRCVLHLYEESLPAAEETEITVEEVERFDHAVDDAVVVAVDRYAGARQRTLVALDQISAAAMSGRDVSRFLNELLGVVLKTVASVDSVVVALKQGDELRVVEAVGLEEEKAAGFTLKVGQGFAGTIAKTTQPLEVRDAAKDPLILSPFIKARGTRALYGVPLMSGEEVLGVVTVGSTTAYEFSNEDKLLIRTMAGRASTMLVEAQLRESEQAAQRAAEAERANLDAFLEAASTGIALLDGSLRFLRVNRALAEGFGTSPEALVGKTVSEAARDGRLQEVLGHYEHVLRTGERVSGVELQREVPPGSGRWRTVQVDFFPVPRNGPPNGVGVVVTDVTWRKRDEEELRKAVEFRERFLGIVSHDLRAPLSGIKIGVTHIARAEDFPPRLTRTANRVKDAIDRMGRMISDLLDFTRGRLGGGIPITPQPVNLRHLARHVVEELQLAHPDHELVLESDPDVTGDWDADRLAQVLSNLCINAIVHGSTPGTVQVALRDDGDLVRIAVTNQGEPIPPDFIPNIFDPFQRGARGNASGGLGLGLYIAREVVRAHGGLVRVSSSRESGTTFIAELPRRPPRRAEGQAGATSGEPAPA